jgi:hypothetical protein
MAELPHPQTPVVRRTTTDSRKPVLTWAAAAIPLLFIIPIAAVGKGWTKTRGDVGDFATMALIAVPITGLICLAGAVKRKEGACPLRLLAFLIHGLWIAGLLCVLLLRAVIGSSESW